eukprot:3196030-Pleurochrysis_carterae.AAC.4
MSTRALLFWISLRSPRVSFCCERCSLLLHKPTRDLGSSLPARLIARWPSRLQLNFDSEQTCSH